MGPLLGISEEHDNLCRGCGLWILSCSIWQVQTAVLWDSVEELVARWKWLHSLLNTSVHEKIEKSKTCYMTELTGNKMLVMKILCLWSLPQSCSFLPVLWMSTKFRDGRSFPALVLRRWRLGKAGASPKGKHKDRVFILYSQILGKNEVFIKTQILTLPKLF